MNRHHDGPMTSVALILVSWNSWRHTVECLDSVLGQSWPRFHVFIVDNDSADQSVEHIAAWCEQPRAEETWSRHEGVRRYTDRGSAASVGHRIFDRPERALPPAPEGCRVTLIRSGSNSGFASGCNIGLRAAGLSAFDYFWFLNTDTVIEHRALGFLVHRAQQDPSIGMVGSTLRYYHRPDVVQAMGGARMDFARCTSRHIGEGASVRAVPMDATVIERELVYIFGASLLVSAGLVREVGPMQEDYFLYYEEIDWAMRARGRFTLAYAPQSHVFHKSGASSSRSRPSLSTRLYYRNRIRFVSRFFPQHLAAVRRGLATETLRFALKGQWAYARIVASVFWNARQIALGN